MPEFSFTLIAIILIAATTLLGLGLKILGGRGRSVSRSEVISLEKLKAEKNGFPIREFGKKATLLMFSTEYCGQCPGVRRNLAQIEYRRGGVSFIEADLTERLDLAAHFSISQTPTIFILNPKGEITYRISGVPKPNIIQQELEKLGA